MPAITPEPDWFFTVSRAADNASWVIRESVEGCSRALQMSSSMAGNDEVGTGWGKSYDDAISDYILQVCRLADAFGAIASRAYIAGLNHLNAEFVAGGKQGAHPFPPAMPTAVDQRVPFAAPPSAVGDNGPGLNTDIPGLLSAIGVAVPNANPAKLADAGEALDALASMIKDKSEDVLSAASTPPPDMGPDAALLHEEILNNVMAPAGHLHEDGATLASAATGFGASVVAKRDEITSEINSLGVSLAITVTAGVLATLVTAGVSNLAAAGLTAVRVAATGRRIVSVIRVLGADSAAVSSSLTSVRAAGGLSARLVETINKPLATFEINEDGTIKTSPVFPKWKQDAWERYLANGGDLSMEEWSKKYDQLMNNVSNGSEWDQEVRDIMGYKVEAGWLPQQRVPGIGVDRVWDFVNLQSRELVENKSGRIDYDQLVKDESALRQGWRVTYNLRDPLSPAQLDRLENLARMYPGAFTYNFLGR